jgi:multimeric flavodoxin WrbA
MMIVTEILGSPRKGSNSAKLADAVVEALPGDNKQVKRFSLGSLDFSGCKACFSCKNEAEACVIKDDLAEVLSASINSDVVVAASPVYIGEVTSQMKTFIDRTYSWLKPGFVGSDHQSRVPDGKTLILIFTQGNPDRGAYSRIIDAYASYFGSHGFKIKTYLAEGLQDEDIAVAKPHLLKEAAALAEGL